MLDMQQKDPQIKMIEDGLVDGQTFHPATRTIQSEWPKMATHKQDGRKKGAPACKVCDNQKEYDAFMATDKGVKTLEPITED